MPFTITAAHELQIPVAVFWTFSACGFMGLYQFRALLDKGLAPLKVTQIDHKTDISFSHDVIQHLDNKLFSFG
ncbi:hypothetical protein ACSBR2_001040 [Camellia fascicularis]